MKRAFLLLLAPALLQAAVAQWTVPSTVVLNGASAEERRVTGLAEPTGNDHGASVQADRYRTNVMGSAQGQDQLTTALQPALDTYRPGLRLTILPEAANNGDATLNVDGLGAISIRKNIVEPLDSADLRPGVPTDLIFDGAVFQVTNQLHPACPSGFAPIGREACVELVSHDQRTWFSSANDCGQRGHRLCSFAEFMQACRMPGGIFPSIVDYEWVDEAANHANYAKLMGNSDLLGINCEAGSLRIPTGFARYRCCSDR